MSPPREYQRRYGGMIEHHSSFHHVLSRPFDKISFALENGRLILRGDGTWEYWDQGGILHLFSNSESEP